MKIFKSRAVVAAGVMAIVVAVAATAYGAASGGSGTVTACVSHSDHTFYKAKKCKQGDAKLSWSQQGPRGASGPQGVPGVPGPKGDPGGPGERGAAGPGAIAIGTTTTSASAGPQAAGSAGPWTFSLTCVSGGPAEWTVNGPGESGGRTILSANPADVYLNPMGPIGSGATSGVGNNGSMELALFLRSGSTVDEMTVLFTDVKKGGVEDCTAVGDVMPIS